MGMKFASLALGAFLLSGCASSPRRTGVCYPGYTNEEFDRLSDSFYALVVKDGKFDTKCLNGVLKKMGYDGPDLKEDVYLGPTVTNDACTNTNVRPSEIYVNGVKTPVVQVMVTAKSINEFLEKEKSQKK